MRITNIRKICNKNNKELKMNLTPQINSIYITTQKENDRTPIFVYNIHENKIEIEVHIQYVDLKIDTHSILLSVKDQDDNEKLDGKVSNINFY
jgi:hypothetical protein